MFSLALASESPLLGWTLLLAATATGWIVNVVLLCRLTRTQRPLIATSSHPSSKRLEDGFLVMDLKEMEALLARARQSRDEKEASHAELQQLTVEDALTGCRNRRAFSQQVPDVWQHHNDSGSDLACLMFDIDYFKRFNDEHGHATGDEVLRQVGETLRSTFAGVGQVYRYGGEEFCVILPEHDLAEAGWIAERVRKSVSEIRVRSTKTQTRVPLSVSVGVSDRRQGADSFETMLGQADECLYLAKRNGRDRVVVYNEEID